MFLDITTIDGARFGLQSSLSAHEFSAFLGRLSPQVPGPFDQAVIDAPNLEVILHNTGLVQPRIGSILFGTHEMTVLLTHIRLADPAQFNEAGIAAANAKYFTQNFL